MRSGRPEGNHNHPGIHSKEREDELSYSCDALGNPLSYRYDSEGIRVGKTVDGENTTYYLNGDKIVTMKTGTGADADLTHYIYDQDDNLVLMKHNGKDYYYIHNVQGDVIGLVDNKGIQVVRYQYNSWGKPTTITDTTAEQVGGKNPFRYRGYYYDSETGWYYLNSRYYDPEVCRFVNADDVDTVEIDIKSFYCKNIYGYCDNNPIIRTDHKGDFWDTVFDVISIGQSAVDVIGNPTKVSAWVSLGADVVCAVIPGLTGGERWIRKGH